DRWRSGHRPPAAPGPHGRARSAPSAAAAGAATCRHRPRERQTRRWCRRPIAAAPQPPELPSRQASSRRRRDSTAARHRPDRPPKIDIRGLPAASGHSVYDPGLTATGTCRSAITYVDGDNGILLYRGYPIEDLVDRCDHLEVAWLLLNGELPTPGQKQQFVSDI